MRLFLTPWLLGLAVDAGCASAASSSFDLHGDDFERVRGAYVLSDGHVMALSGTRRHPRIEFDDGRTQALRALSATEYVADGSCTRVSFEAHANASVTRVRVTRACGA